MTTTSLKGSCLCGAVTYTVTGEPKRFYHCHCMRCRKATGTGHASNIFLQPGTLTWLSGEEQIRAFKPPEAQRFTNSFCATCGSPIYSALDQRPEVRRLRLGTVDTPFTCANAFHIYTGAKASWWDCDDGLPRFASYLRVRSTP